MTVTLDEIRKEFPTAGYAPDPACQYCHGTGTRGPRKVIVIRRDLSVETEERPEEGDDPCICIFVGDPRTRDIAVNAFRTLAGGELARLGKAAPGD
jgi:hypothetical protein